MAEENADLTAQNEELDEQEELVNSSLEETDDLDVLKENLVKLQEANKQLYSRAKKGEGFVKGEGGKWVKKPVEPIKPEPKPVIHSSSTMSDEDIDKKLDEKLEKRELEALEISDTLKKEIAVYAKLNGVSIKKALESDYIQFKKDKEDTEVKTDEASLGGGKRGTTKKDYGQIDPKKLDHTTEKGKTDFSK